MMLQRTSEHSITKLDDMPAIINLFKKSFEENGRGEIIISGIGVRAGYDLYTGEVGPIEFVQSGSVQIDYANDVQEVLTNQVTEQLGQAITLFARIYLLEKLLELGDDKITKIIRQRHCGGGV